MTAHGASGSNQRVCHRLLRHLEAFGDLLLHQRFPVVEVDHLLLAWGQDLQVVEEHVDGAQSHVEARKVLGIDPSLFHAGDQILDQITDTTAARVDGAFRALGPVGARLQRLLVSSVAVQMRKTVRIASRWHRLALRN